MADNARESSRTTLLEVRAQTGSVIEFAFVNNGLPKGKGLENGYFATSYPYPLPKERQPKRYIARYANLSAIFNRFGQNADHPGIQGKSPTRYGGFSQQELSRLCSQRFRKCVQLLDNSLLDKIQRI